MLTESSKVSKKGRVNRTAISCDRCKARKTKCNKPDADGPCDYCRSTDAVCSIDIAKRRQKPFYFVSEEEYRLLRELCSQCYPNDELTLPNLRRLVSEAKALPTVAQPSLVTTDDVTVMDYDKLLTPAITQNTFMSDIETVPLPEITTLHHELGCLLPDAHGQYRYIGAESGVSFNGAVRSWMLSLGSRAKPVDRDKIPPLVKVTPPAARSPLSSSSKSSRSIELLPPQELLITCSARFFEYVNCLYWLYSSEDFYTRLEKSYSKRGCQQTGSWLCSLQSLVALCAMCDPESSSTSCMPEALETAKSLVPSVCDESDLDSIRALILLALALQSSGFTNSAYVHLGTAIRIAFSLGLHLDKYSTRDSLVVKAQTRRLWWTLFLLDQDLSLQVGKPCMTASLASYACKTPLPSEHVVGPGSHTPTGYLEQAIQLAQLTRDIRQRLYDGPVHNDQLLTHGVFFNAMQDLKDWLKEIPPHLHLSASVSPLYRRSISMLHLRYWSTVMLVTKPFLLFNLLRGEKSIEETKQPIFDQFARACLAAAESSFEILDTMVSHNAVSSLVFTDFFFALQTLQVILAACGVYQDETYRNRARQCLKLLLAISVSGFPKHLLPETLFQLQQFGLVEESISAAEHLDSNQISASVHNNGEWDITNDQLSGGWPSDLNMTEFIVDQELWESLIDLTEIFPLDQIRS